MIEYINLFCTLPEIIINYIVKYWDKLQTFFLTVTTIVSIWFLAKNNRLNREILAIRVEAENKEKAQIQNKKKYLENEEEEYFHHIKKRFSYIDLNVLNLFMDGFLKLENIYIKLKPIKTLFKPESLCIQEVDGYKNIDEKIESFEFIKIFEYIKALSSKTDDSMMILLLGDPGSGKTTLLKWIALECASEKDNSFRGHIPLFIPLKDLIKEPYKTFNKMNLAQFSILLLNSISLPSSFIDSNFRKGKLLFLFDGIDELPDESIRNDFIFWIQQQVFGKNICIVTSRYSGIQESKNLMRSKKFNIYAIQDFDQADRIKFLKNWYIDCKNLCTDTSDINEIREVTPKGFEELISIIEDNTTYNNLRKLAVNPLLLSIIAIIHQKKSAVLPKEMHKLYEEAVRVMIEMWCIARGCEIGFSIENSLANLSEIANYLMVNNQRELEYSKIFELLPEKIESKSADIFVQEMIDKCGLIYHSQGNIGFLHFTFIEYLTAYYYSKKIERPTKILEYRSKENWKDTYKLFVNIYNPNQFFSGIIENLIEKQYWKQMNLWDDCILSISEEKAQQTIENKFSKTIISILKNIPYEEKQEQKIIQLHAHYSLYKQSNFLNNELWSLFNDSKHPYIKSTAISILFSSGNKNTLNNVIESLKKEFNKFDLIEEPSNEECLKFLMENVNSFLLILRSLKKLSDFKFFVEKIGSSNLFLKFYLLFDLNDLKNFSYLKGQMNTRDLRELRDLVNLLNLNELVTFNDFVDLEYIRYLRYLRYLKDSGDLKYLRNIEKLSFLNKLIVTFNEEYKEKIKKKKEFIDDRVKRALEKINNLTEEQLSSFFCDLVTITNNEELQSNLT